MIAALLPSHAPRRVTIRTADAAAWRIKPEIRTLANIIAERELAACHLLPLRKVRPRVWSKLKTMLFIRDHLLGDSNPFGGRAHG